MTRRVYTETANSYAPFRQAQLQGIGAAKLDKDGWPVGRSYVGIAHFRAPYDEFSYFQDNSLQGLGMSNKEANYTQTLGAVNAGESAQLNQTAPGAVKRFLLSGDPVSPIRQNITLPFNQVHPYVYGAIAAAAAVTSYLSYKRWKKQNPRAGI
jgi:hypothetical protein